MTGSQKQTFDQMVNAISKIIADERLLREKYASFLNDKKDKMLCPFTPYLNDYIRVAAGRHYLPFLIPKKKMTQMLDFISCESHRDVLVESLQDHIEK